jgi:hypothetical protein
MERSLNMGRNTASNVEDPSDAHDAVNKRYVDGHYVNIGNFRPRLIGNGTDRPAAPGIVETLIPATKPLPRTVIRLVILYQATNIIREHINEVVPDTSPSTPVIRHKTVTIVDMSGDDDGHIRQYMEMITENGSRYLRMGYSPSRSNPNIVNVYFVLLSQNSEHVNITRISIKMYNSARTTACSTLSL